jgi:predicted glutamine amidotransferase
MCRLLGIVGTPPLPAKKVLQAFYPLCTVGHVKCIMKPGHLDGWGVSGFNGERAVYFDRKAESAADGKPLFEKAADKAERANGPVVIAHFRKASAGARDIRNTHPFHQRDWIFAHNGTVYNAAELKLADSTPQGQTDSERLFCWILEQVHDELDPTAALVKLLKEWRPKLVFSALNFLMTDGKTLWAYRDYGDKNLEPGETVEEREKYYTLYWTSLGKSVVICSEPLKTASASWQPFKERTLAVFTPTKLSPQIIPI